MSTIRDIAIDGGGAIKITIEDACFNDDNVDSLRIEVKLNSHQLETGANTLTENSVERKVEIRNYYSISKAHNEQEDEDILAHVLNVVRDALEAYKRKE